MIRIYCKMCKILEWGIYRVYMSPVSLIFHIKSTVNSCPQIYFNHHGHLPTGNSPWKASFGGTHLCCIFGLPMVSKLDIPSVSYEAKCRLACSYLTVKIWNFFAQMIRPFKKWKEVCSWQVSRHFTLSQKHLQPAYMIERDENWVQLKRNGKRQKDKQRSQTKL